MGFAIAFCCRKQIQERVSITKLVWRCVYSFFWIMFPSRVKVVAWGGESYKGESTSALWEFYYPFRTLAFVGFWIVHFYWNSEKIMQPFAYSEWHGGISDVVPNLAVAAVHVACWIGIVAMVVTTLSKAPKSINKYSRELQRSEEFP